MAEGGFDLRQNFNFSDSDSEVDEDRTARDVRERLFVFGLDRDISPDRKESLEVGSQSSQNKQENDQADTTEVVSSANDHSSNLNQPAICSAVYENVTTRRRSRTSSFGRLMRRLSRHRRRSDIDDAYREIEIGSVGGRMPTAGLEIAQNLSTNNNGTSTESIQGRRFRQRPQSTVVLRPRTANVACEKRTRRPNSFIGRVCKLFDSNNENARDSQASSSNEETSSSNSTPDPDTPNIRFPIGVNELVAIRRERARLRVEQTRIEYHIIPDILNVTNCPWYWGKINRFEAERVLEGQSDGTFLLRDSAQHHYLFSVSFRRYFRTYHARIEQWKHNYSFDKPSEFSFRSRNLCDLLEHYSQAEKCMYYEPLLLTPFPRKSALPLQHLCRAIICNETTFQGVEELPLPKSLKLYLREYHYKVAVKKMEDKGTQTAPCRKIFGIYRN